MYKKDDILPTHAFSLHPVFTEDVRHHQPVTIFTDMGLDLGPWATGGLPAESREKGRADVIITKICSSRSAPLE